MKKNRHYAYIQQEEEEEVIPIGTFRKTLFQNDHVIFVNNEENQVTCSPFEEEKTWEIKHDLNSMYGGAPLHLQR